MNTAFTPYGVHGDDILMQEMGGSLGLELKALQLPWLDGRRER
jgi:hypothetical protein